MFLFWFIFVQVLQVCDKTHKAHQGVTTEYTMLHEASDDDMAVLNDVKGEVKVVTDHPEDEVESVITSDRPTSTSEIVDNCSDEGWQEAYSKGRSGHAAGRKFGRRRPDLTKLIVQNPYNSNSREGGYKREAISSVEKTAPMITTTELSQTKQSKTSSLCVGDVLIKLQSNGSVSRVSPSPTNLNAIASKSVSYKEVALAPPGTVLKPTLEKTEDNTETQICSTLEISEMERSVVSPVECIPAESITRESEQTRKSVSQSEISSPNLEEIHISSDQEKQAEINGSKLSASAEPFNPGALSLNQPLNGVAIGGTCDIIASQGIIAEPVAPPVAARVPCGPRSPLYYRTNQSYRVKHVSFANQTPAFEERDVGRHKVMNPNAPEFVPRKAWQTDLQNMDLNVECKINEDRLDENSGKQVKGGDSKRFSSEAEKSELARQILLSFIVKSVNHNKEPSTQSEVKGKKFDGLRNSSDAVANDRAIIKIRYGNEGKETGIQSRECEKANPIDEKKKKNGDSEGFIVVRKRRRKRQQFTNEVSDLYNQQSICASVH